MSKLDRMIAESLLFRKEPRERKQKKELTFKDYIKFQKELKELRRLAEEPEEGRKERGAEGMVGQDVRRPEANDPDDHRSDRIAGRTGCPLEVCNHHRYDGTPVTD